MSVKNTRKYLIETTTTAAATTTTKTNKQRFIFSAIIFLN
jgi:hypothetical protein